MLLPHYSTLYGAFRRSSSGATTTVAKTIKKLVVKASVVAVRCVSGVYGGLGVRRAYFFGSKGRPRNSACAYL